MNAVLVILKKELLFFFRDRYTRIYSIYVPILLYPLIFWGMNQVMMLQEGAREKLPSRVAFAGEVVPELLIDIIDSDELIEISRTVLPEVPIDFRMLRNAGLDAVINVKNCRPLQLQIIFDGSQDRSITARKRLEDISRKFALKQMGTASGSGLNAMETVIFDISSQEEKSRFLLGIILPMIIVIITVMGGLYPAINVVVGEREHKTLETTLTAPIPYMAIIAGKYAAVIIMSMTASLLNLASMLLTLKHTLFLSESFEKYHFTIPLNAIPIILTGILLIAALFSALMMLTASFSAGFKEAQSSVSTLYAFGIQPAVISALPGIPFNKFTALIPISNVSLMFREAIHNKFPPIPILITLGMITGLSFVCLLAARHFISRDALFAGHKPNGKRSRKNIKYYFKKRTGR